MHWILAAILVLRTLIPCGIGVADPSYKPGVTAPCPVETSPADSPRPASEPVSCICCEIGSCLCEMAPAPIAPAHTPEPVSPGTTSNARPVLLSIDPPTNMVVGWLDDPIPHPLGEDAVAIHATLGHSVQAALCVWQN